jgi:hypothetical protein
MKRLLVSMVVMSWGVLGWGAGAVEQTDLTFADAAAKDQAGIVAEPSSWSLFFYLAIDNELEVAGDLTLANMLEATAGLEYHPRILVLVDRLSRERTDVFENGCVRNRRRRAGDGRKLRRAGQL